MVFPLTVITVSQSEPVSLAPEAVKQAPSSNLFMVEKVFRGFTWINVNVQINTTNTNFHVKVL